MTPVNPAISGELALTPIRRFMTRTPFYATPSTTVRRAMQMMLTHKVSGLPVTDDSESMLGIYSELDAMLQAASSPSMDVPIRYTKPALTVLPDTPFRDVLILLVKKKIKRVPVVDNRNKLMGIVSRQDIMRALAEDTPKPQGKT